MSIYTNKKNFVSNIKLECMKGQKELNNDFQQSPFPYKFWEHYSMRMKQCA